MPPLNNFSDNTNNNNDIISALSVQPTTAAGLSGSGQENRGFFSTEYAQKLLFNLNSLRQNLRFCDVDIIIGDTLIHAHRAVLSASSAYFEAMFRPELGLSEGKQKSVTLHSIRPDILKILIDFIYTGQIEIKQVK